MYVAVDIGGTKTEIGFFENENVNSLLYHEKFETSQSFEAQFNSISSVIEQHYHEIKSINVSFPGWVNETNEILRCINIPGYKNKPLKQELQSKFKVDVRIIHDSTCAALAEVKYGNLKNFKKAVHLIWGTGLGGALIQNEEKLKIRSIEPGGQIVKAFNGRTHKFSAVNGLIEAYVGGGSVEDFYNINLSEVSDDHKIWEEIVDYLAIGINNINCLIKPEAIILGGGISIKRPFLIGKVNQKLKLYNEFLEPVIVELTKVKGNASLIGALAANFAENLEILN